MRWTEKDVPSQEGKIAIVTGANSGLGFETARVLAAKGAHVVLACRNAEKGRAAEARILEAHPEASVQLASLDLQSLASIRQFAADFRQQHPRLDVLVNNAGIMMTPLSKTQDGFESQIGTNHFGHFALTGSLLPALLAAPAPRVVSVSSVAHKFGKIDFDNLNAEKRYGKISAYGQSKLANLLFTYELGRWAQSKGLNLTAVASHPGWTATNLQNDVGWIRFLNPIFAMTPLQGAMPSLYGATAEDVKSGEYFGPDGLLEWRGGPTRVKSTKRSHDLEVAKRLWDVSERLTGVRFEVPMAQPLRAAAN